MGIQRIDNRLHSFDQVNTRKKDAGGNSFGKELADKMQDTVGEYRFSAHARTRMKSRNIHLTDEMMNKLNKAIHGAEQKGAHDTLVLLSDLAFIVNVPRKTVVTAMDGACIKENVFTNIDSTVIAD